MDPMTSQPQSNPSMTQELLAGTAAGFAILVVGHPFDLMKVRMQVAPTSSARSVLKRFADVIMSEGVFSLYKGMGAPMLAVPLLNAIVFASFGQARTAILNGSVRDLSPTESASAGAIAGLVNSTVASPIELVKCRLQVQMGGIGLYQGPVDCVRRILATDGVRGIFQGMSATIVREVPCYAAQFYTYENLKQYLAGPEREALGIGEQLLIGGLAGIACWIVSYPQVTLFYTVDVSQRTWSSQFCR
uniref:Mitochondrial carrier protein n=1 Tax=Spongospora subterranea TaxID=70186 RepID=A0A0H5R4B3_9EUKA|eukprot:CRZ02869.1 hypothetical protein [Spongospora subterranea]